jgi:hypothetical protein
MEVQSSPEFTPKFGSSTNSADHGQDSGVAEMRKFEEGLEEKKGLLDSRSRGVYVSGREERSKWSDKVIMIRNF